MNKKHRIFIAINLPEDIKRELSKYQDKWPELPAKWTTKDNLHITLEFLGDLTDEELGEVCLVVKEVAKRHSSFSISLSKVIYGPIRLRSGQAPKFVWSLGEKSLGRSPFGRSPTGKPTGEADEFSDLKNDLQEYLLEKIAFRPEGKGFVPHITLARINEWEWKKIEPEERPEVDENIEFIFTVESIEVMESVLKRGGPQYTVVESHSFRE